MPLHHLVLEGDLSALEHMPRVCTHYGDQAIPSWVRWVFPGPSALYLCSASAHESPWVPVQASLSWCDLYASSYAPVP
jgi:hypothetical protein